MNITFEWNDIALSPEQKARMEENIRKEIPGLDFVYTVQYFPPDVPIRLMALKLSV